MTSAPSLASAWRADQATPEHLARRLCPSMRTNVLHSAAMRLWPNGDPIRVTADSDGRPLAFVWQGESHKVATIEDVREPKLDWWSVTGEVHRVYYLVSTNLSLICEIFRDEAGGEGREPGAWAMARVFD